jgi:hypothetical protein
VIDLSGFAASTGVHSKYQASNESGPHHTERVMFVQEQAFNEIETRLVETKVETERTIEKSIEEFDPGSA